MLDVISTFSIHSCYSRRNRQTGNLSKGSTARQSTRPNQKFYKIQLDDIPFKTNPKSEQREKVEIKAISELNRQIETENENTNQFGSNVYPLINFQKISYRQLLKEIKFEKDIKSLHPSDKRNLIIYKIMRELFQELQFEIQNILICQHPISKLFYIYFSDTDYCPMSKCCNQNVVIRIGEILGGEIKCLNPKCHLGVLTTFEIVEKILWNSKFQQKQVISSLISSGKYRTKSLLQSVQVPQDHNAYAPKQQQQFQNTWKRSSTFYQRTSQTNYEQIYKYELSKNLLLNSQIFNKNFDDQIDEKYKFRCKF
ncbi:unnamed protein product [Paramecium primaurelia]|uniref:Uncharacterized protein n=1 Tax=Paramecium primaurelia TaxID=5886 RepID=A0A8S1KB11_PARPR|nr:unnamed protein product [Paramecium primaurelia]